VRKTERRCLVILRTARHSLGMARPTLPPCDTLSSNNVNPAFSANCFNGFGTRANQRSMIGFTRASVGR
jgi:hypothetical protein